jgi:hypothetical protein
MTTTLTIKDLSINKELDRKAMLAVRGGVGNQAIAEQQSNTQFGVVNMNVGNGSTFNGPTTIQANSSLKQEASNFSFSKNFSNFFGLGFPA